MPQPFHPDPPLVLGILGGVGSGKSTLSALLESQGLLTLDADREAARVLASKEMCPILEDLFGPAILGPEGPDRARIAKAVFSDPGLRSRLEEAMHPRIRHTLLAELELQLDSGQSVVLDFPLLLESGLIDRCDRLLFLEVPDQIREERALASGMDSEDWQRRESAQADLTLKRGHSDHVFDNSGTIEDLKTQVLAWLEKESDLSHG